MDPLTPEYQLRGVVIYLIGVPAVGKCTIATEIGRLTGARVVDNQLINLPVFSVLGYDGKDSFPFPAGAWKHIETIRTSVLSTIREHCGPEKSFVFTNVLQAGCSGDEALFHGIEQLAADRGSRFFPVWLSCSEEKLRERKDTPDRRARLKDTDLANISDYLRRFQVYRVPHRNGLDLDTSDRTPEDSARRIIAHLLDWREARER